jgi:hypothetical protein
MLITRPHLAARLLRQHLAYGALTAEEQPAQADVQDDVPVVLARLEQALRMAPGDHRVVHDHVEAAVAQLQRGCDQAVDVARAPDISLDEARHARGVGDQLIGRGATHVQGLAADVAHDDAGSLGGERDAQGAPDPRRASGDDDRAVLESRHAADGRAPAPTAAPVSREQRASGSRRCLPMDAAWTRSTRSSAARTRCIRRSPRFPTSR